MLEPSDEEMKLFEECLEPLITLCRPALDEIQVKGYFNALFDLPAEAVFLAASELAGTRLSDKWPMPGEIRATWARMSSPQLPVGEAWKIALNAVARMGDPWIDQKNGMTMHEWNERIFAALPPAIRATVRCLKSTLFRTSTTSYAQFRDEYLRQVEVVRQPIMTPAPVRAMTAALFASVEMPKAIEQAVQLQADELIKQREKVRQR